MDHEVACELSHFLSPVIALISVVLSGFKFAELEMSESAYSWVDCSLYAVTFRGCHSRPVAPILLQSVETRDNLASCPRNLSHGRQRSPALVHASLGGAHRLGFSHVIATRELCLIWVSRWRRPQRVNYLLISALWSPVPSWGSSSTCTYNIVIRCTNTREKNRLSKSPGGSAWCRKFTDSKSWRSSLRRLNVDRPVTVCTVFLPA